MTAATSAAPSQGRAATHQGAADPCPDPRRRRAAAALLRHLGRGGLVGATASPSGRVPHDRLRPAGHRPVADARLPADHVGTGPLRRRGTRRTRHTVRPRARRFVRWRGRTADGVLVPQPGSPAGAGVDILRRLRHAGQPESSLALHPPAQLSSGTSGTGGRGDVRRAAAHRAGACPLDAHPAADRYPGRPVPDGPAVRLDEPAVAVGHRPARPGHRRRRRPRHPAGESPDHRLADAPGDAARGTGRRAPGPA